MSAVKQQCDAQGIGLERFHLLPTLCWFDASDGFLNFQCAAGTILAVLLIFGIAPAPCLGPALAALSFADHRWPRFSRFSMGQSAARSRLPRHFFRAAAMAAPKLSRRSAAVANRSLAAAAAAVQAHVFFRLRETVQRRPDLAQSHRAHLSLSNPAAADVDWLVCATNCRCGSKNFPAPRCSPSNSARRS